MILHFRQPKEAQVKTFQVQCLPNPDLCPTRTALLFQQRSSALRTNLATDHTFFLAYIEDMTMARTVRPTTVSNWIKERMKTAGIDTTLYKPHSIRSASSTKAVENGNSIPAVKKHGGWSTNADTLERFYLKPIKSTSSSTIIAQSILSHNTDNSTTLEVGAEATEVGLGTTANHNAAEAKTENVVRPTQSISWFQWLTNTPPNS
ncbi:hypothetical protein G6F29_013670 [Rhizopus arrhizus]|uniref:Tyr recombinase domain-containing protein n=1 Tax=Rhizopus oryzae TaxID=64495 RepID=A0A9P6WV12_RHIOR|nr:hypothetical protein G6F30_013633 [Rhizopus arrhizus]KAG0972155.1 hypothetical protein G6F29_013670 [Rhizopus arrhizus]KAG0973417.1 hypothetical protein G6F28_013622 [Rhizopus arrhizus]KAG1010228.1 hypothetical protein G6F26_013594 [Rhizopus arrhizus]KAG1082366.1 hypothetical protein G6F39_013660 [Rhizopus arrhizus]